MAGKKVEQQKNEESLTADELAALEVPGKIIALPQSQIQYTGPTPMTLLAGALESGADIDKLRALMDMQAEWEERQAKKAFINAMASFKQNLPELTKDKKVSYTTKSGDLVQYDHVTLGNAAITIGKALAEHGLSFNWQTTQDQTGRIFVTCNLTHRDGFTQSTTMDGAADTSGSKNNIQAVGSTVKYLQRYTLLLITGVTPADDIDDDGDGGAPANLAQTKGEAAKQTAAPRKSDVKEGEVMPRDDKPKPEGGQAAKPAQSTGSKGNPITEGARKLMMRKFESSGKALEDFEAAFPEVTTANFNDAMGWIEE